jgi:phosphatidylserine decarboxylase
MNSSNMKIEKFTIGQKVKMASMGNLVFTIIAENTDGTYSVETQLDQQNVLSYGNISKEMLRNATA